MKSRRRWNEYVSCVGIKNFTGFFFLKAGDGENERVRRILKELIVRTRN
jgi:hypothetical protein